MWAPLVGRRHAAAWMTAYLNCSRTGGELRVACIPVHHLVHGRYLVRSHARLHEQPLLVERAPRHILVTQGQSGDEPDGASPAKGAWGRAE